jgi:hypothetical protein
MLAALILLPGASAATTSPHAAIDDEIYLSDVLKAELAMQMTHAGINCPHILKLSYADENARGSEIRISCASKDGTTRWDIRGTLDSEDKIHPK